MATAKLTWILGASREAIAVAGGTAISGAPAVEVNVDFDDKMGKADVLRGLNMVRDKLVTQGWPPVAAAPAVVEAEITAVDADGNFVTLAAAPASDVPLLPIVVKRNGYNSAGSLEDWNETILLTQRKINPVTVGTLAAGTDIATSSVIFQGDTFTNQPSVPNASTRLPPRIEGRWVETYSGIVVGNTVAAAADFITSYPVDGLPVERVEFYWSDGTDTVTAVGALSPYIGVVSGYCAHRWSVSGVDITALDEGRVTLDWRAYGRYGQLYTSAQVTAALNISSRNGGHDIGTLYLRKHVAMAAAPVHFFFSATAGNNGTGVASEVVATARANPFANHGQGLVAAVARNTALYGVAGADGVVCVALNTGANIAPNRNAATAQPCLIAGWTMIPDPLEVSWPAGGPTIAFASNENWFVGSSTNPGGDVSLHWRGFNYLRTASTFTFSNTITHPARIYLVGAAGGSTFDLATLVTGTPFINAPWHPVRYTFTGAAAGSGTALNYNTNGGMATAIDCDFSGVGTSAANASGVSPSGLIACKGGNQYPIPLAGSLQAGFIDGWTSYTTGAADIAFSVQNHNTARAFVKRNVLFVDLNGTENNGTEVSSDNKTYSVTDMAMLGVTFAAASQAFRSNHLYTEGVAGGSRLHFGNTMRGCILPAIANKGAAFENDAARDRGCREYRYGVGCIGNHYNHLFRVPKTSDTALIYLGVGADAPPNTTTYNDPLFVLDRTPTVLGGATGATDGNYRSSATVAPYPRPNRYDILGRVLSSTITKVGAYAGEP